MNNVCLFFLALDKELSTQDTQVSLLSRQLKYQNEALSGIYSNLLAHSRLNPDIRLNYIIQSNCLPLWQSHYLPSLNEAFLTSNISISVRNTIPASYYYQHHFLSKVEAIFEAYNEALTQGCDFFVFLDGDHISLRPWLFDVLERLDSNMGDISMALECGHISLKPYPTYNSGLIAMKICDQNSALLASWLSLSRKIFSTPEIKLGDQHSLVVALNKHKPRLFTLPDVYNLRCHDVYGGTALCWSPIYAIHNHLLSSVVIKSLILSMARSQNVANSIASNFIFSVNNYFTPSSDPYKPRIVHLSRTGLLDLLFNS